MRTAKEAARLVELGKKIREIRMSKGFSQTEFANMIGKDQPSINRLERGLINPGILYLDQVAAGLDVESSDLLKR